MKNVFSACLELTSGGILNVLYCMVLKKGKRGGTKSNIIFTPRIMANAFSLLLMASLCCENDEKSRQG